MIVEKVNSVLGLSQNEAEHVRHRIFYDSGVPMWHSAKIERLESVNLI